MKILLYLFISIIVLSGSDIDKRYFSDNNRSVFLNEMQKSIDTNQNTELKLLEEKLLSNINQLEAKSSKIDYTPISFDSNKTVDVTVFKSEMDNVVSAIIDQQNSNAKLNQLLFKLDYVKKQIKSITVDNKDELSSYQLQYTLYQLSINKENEKQALLNTFITQGEDTLQQTIKWINTETYDKKLKELKVLHAIIKEDDVRRMALSAQLERELLVETSNKNILLQKKEKEDSIRQKDTLELLNSFTMVALMDITKNNQKHFYALLKEINDLINTLDEESANTQRASYELLKNFAKAHFGRASIMLMASKESLTDSFKYIKNLYYSPLFVFNERAFSTASIMKIIIILIIGFIIAALFRRRISKWESKTKATTKIIENFGYYLIILITLIIALNSVGIDLSSISMLASAFAIGIGFGLQTVVSNLVAGIIMVFERSIRIGDYVEISQELQGTVTDMRIRSTVIKTYDNIDVIVPNSSFIQNNVINFTLDDKSRRLHVPFGVAYGTDVEMVKRVVLEGLEESGLRYYKNDTTKEADVRMVAMGPSGIECELLVWVLLANKQHPYAKLSDFLIMVYKTLMTHGIEIPFPQMDIRVKEGMI